jgi:hypothetical protein
MVFVKAIVILAFVVCIVIDLALPRLQSFSFIKIYERSDQASQIHPFFARLAKSWSDSINPRTLENILD